MRGLDIAAVHFNFSVAADVGLREIERVVVVFGVAEGDGDVVGGGALADSVRFGGVPAEGAFHVFGYHIEVDGRCLFVLLDYFLFIVIFSLHCQLFGEGRARTRSNPDTWESRAQGRQSGHILCWLLPR